MALLAISVGSVSNNHDFPEQVRDIHQRKQKTTHLIDALTIPVTKPFRTIFRCPD